MEDVDNSEYSSTEPEVMGPHPAASPTQPTLRRPKKALPARKLSSQKQFEVLRGFAIASGHARNSVVINDVAGILEIHSNSVSVCNAFFNEIGLVEKQGHKFLPSAEVFEYSNAEQWNPDTSGAKLQPILRNSWFADALIPRLQMRTIQEDDAIVLLAEACGASPEYKTQLVMLVDYLVFSGLVERENGTLKLVSSNKVPKKSDAPPKDPVDEGGRTPPIDPTVDSFEIPIPGKSPAHIVVPKGLTDSDWSMLTTMLEAYITRLRETDQ